MSSINFSKDVAKRLEAVYMTPDVVAQRQATLQRLQLREGESVIDLGSGPGFLCESMADIVGPTGRVLGVDISADFIERSMERNERRWLAYRVGDAIAVDEPDATFDAVTCTQVAEYIAEVDKAIAEAFRVLKPGGRALFVATDWDSVIWHSENPARMSAVMRSWEAHCAHPRLPRTMTARLKAPGFVLESATVFPILNLVWSDDTYGKGIARFIRDFVARRGDIPEADVTAWFDEFPRLSEQGRYFFNTSRFIFVGSKPRT
jgi:ubiquinone/menaquinone biosynthesis C-methylase UbiE